jgi:hypothetical protein
MKYKFARPPVCTDQRKVSFFTLLQISIRLYGDIRNLNSFTAKLLTDSFYVISNSLFWHHRTVPCYITSAVDEASFDRRKMIIRVVLSWNGTRNHLTLKLVIPRVHSSLFLVGTVHCLNSVM